MGFDPKSELGVRLKGLTVQFGVTSYNEGKGIVPTLESLGTAARSCGFEKPDVLLSDSSDTTEAVDAAREWAERDGIKLAIHRSETRRSAKEALDAIFDVATADLLVTMDADVLIPSESLAWLLWDLIDEPQAQIAIGVVLPEAGHRGMWGAASGWQMKVARRICKWAPRDSVHAQGALVGMRKSLYSEFRFARRAPGVTETFSEDTALARRLVDSEVPTRNSWRAVALKVPTRTARDFYLQTHRAYAAVGGFDRSSKDILAAALEAAKDPWGATAYLYGRWWASREARRNPAAFQEMWPVANSTKR